MWLSSNKALLTKQDVGQIWPKNHILKTSVGRDGYSAQMMNVSLGPWLPRYTLNIINQQHIFKLYDIVFHLCWNKCSMTLL